IAQENVPRIEREAAASAGRTKAEAGVFSLASAVDIGAGIDWVNQDQMDHLLGRFGPDQVAAIGATVHPPQHPQAVVAKEVENLRQRPELFELAEDRPQCPLHFLVRVQLDLSLPVTDEADG